MLSWDRWQGWYTAVVNGEVAKVGQELAEKRKNVLNIAENFKCRWQRLQPKQREALGPVDREWCRDLNYNADDGCDSELTEGTSTRFSQSFYFDSCMTLMVSSRVIE